MRKGRWEAQALALKKAIVSSAIADILLSKLIIAEQLLSPKSRGYILQNILKESIMNYKKPAKQISPEN